MVYLGHIYSSSLTWAFAARAPCSTFALLEEESAQEQTPPCDMPVRGSIWKQNSAPLPFCWVKKSLLPKHCCPQTQLSVKGAFKWRKFSLISAHHYYAETPDKVNILTSFLKRIWFQLSESFSELKIGWFLWHLDQKIALTPVVNFYRARIGAQFNYDITSVFNVTMDAFNWLSQQLCVLPVILHLIIFKLFSPNAPSASKFKDIKNPLDFLEV